MHDFAENSCPNSVAAPISVGSILFREGEADRINGFCRCDAYYIFYVSEGSLTVCADFSEISVNEGFLLALPPGSVWRIQADTACSGKLVSFSPDSSCFSDEDIRFLRSAEVFSSFGKAHVIDAKAEPVGEILELLNVLIVRKHLSVCCVRRHTEPNGNAWQCVPMCRAALRVCSAERWKRGSARAVTPTIM